MSRRLLVLSFSALMLGACQAVAPLTPVRVLTTDAAQDAQMDPVDASGSGVVPPLPDTVTPPPGDAATALPPDAAMPPPTDAATQPPGDATQPLLDAVTPPLPDAATPPLPDAATEPPPDAAAQPPDAAAPPPDAATPPPDVAIPPPDVAPPPPDATDCAPSLEICDGLDNNCDGRIDEGVLLTFFVDFDRDGFGDAASAISACTPPAGTVGVAEDCDDGTNAVNPDAPEICNLIDDNCDELVDDGCPICGNGLVEAGEVCDDGPNNGPLQPCNNTCRVGCLPVPEVCGDALDNDCDGLVDDGCPPPCVPQPGADICDQIDNDCDGQVDEDGQQSCDDNLACTADACTPAGCTNTPVPETCNGLDDDCNGQVDEGRVCACGVFLDCVFGGMCVGGACEPDTCPGGLPIIDVTGPNSYPGNSAGSTDQFPSSCGAPGVSEVAFTFVALANQTVCIDTIGSLYDTILDVEADTCGVQPTVCNDDTVAIAPLSRVEINLLAGVRYNVRIEGVSGATGNYVLNTAPGPCPP